jgi:hypothetical protein
MHPTRRHPRRRPWPTVLLLLVTAIALALLAVVLIAPPAGAHASGGVGPPAQVRQAPPILSARSDPHDDPRPPGGA